MRRTGLMLILVLAVAGAFPAAAEQTCLSVEDTRSSVQQHGLVSLHEVIRSVQSANPADLISARLCETNGNMVYMIALLGKNGRVMRMTIDARTGEVINHR
jgi:uncharacterized membrane protein YkoI